MLIEIETSQGLVVLKHKKQLSQKVSVFEPFKENDAKVVYSLYAKDIVGDIYTHDGWLFIHIKHSEAEHEYKYKVIEE